MSQKFMTYPEYDDPDFYQKIYSKKEFYDNKAPILPNFKSQADIERFKINACNPRQFTLQNYQTFVRNFVSTTTNYNGLLLFWGVGTGKCVLPDTTVYANGKLIPIKDIWDNFHNNDIVLDSDYGEWSTPNKPIYVNVYDKTQNKIIEFPVNRLYRQKINEPINMIKLQNGTTLKLTQQHKLLTEHGWTNNLHNACYVAIPQTLINTQDIQQLNRETVAFLGWHLAIGYENTEDQSLLIDNIDQITCDLLTDMFKLLCKTNNLRYETLVINKSKGKCGLKIKSSDYIQMLQEYGHQWGNRKIPDNIMVLPHDKLREFLKSYCDACLLDDEVLQFNHVTSEIAEQLYHLFKLFGIELIREPCPSIDQRFWDKYYNEINFNLLNKKIKLARIVKLNNCVNLPNNGIIMSKLVNVCVELYDGYVYDLEVNIHHNYVANGIICHNTCGAVQIAEGLKEEVKKYGKKIYIITKNQLKQNFIKELYNRDRATQERNLNIPAGSMHCAGDAYYISPNEISNQEKREKAILNKIYKHYKFFTPRKFTNAVDCEIALKLPKGTTIGDYFSNSVFIIDEAHNLNRLEEEETKEENIHVETVHDDQKIGEHCIRTERHDRQGQQTFVNQSDRKVIDVFNEIFAKSTNTKLILLTATPMRDTASDLTLLLDLLLRNDKRHSLDDKIPNPPGCLVGSNPTKSLETYRDCLFYGDDQVNENLLRYLARGYVSYVRGEDPASFPRIRDATNIDVSSSTRWLDKRVYIPNPIFDDQNKIIQQQDKMVRINVVRCPMHIYQYSHYVSIMSEINRTQKDKLGDIVGRQVSNIIFPNVSVRGKSQLYGAQGFKNVFKDESITIELEKSSSSGKGNPRKRRIVKYMYKKGAENFLHISNIGKYSGKFETFMHNIIKSQGIAYAYTDFIEAGAKILALMLEANGYQRYDKPGFLHGDFDAGQQRCAICGHIRVSHGRRVEGTCSTFTQAKYIIFTGDDAITQHDLDTINHVNNKDGQNIKVVIGTRVSGEGIDFKMIQSVHIIDPWHNNTRLYQVIGRAARHCSHISLDEKHREVVVYKYCSSPPDLYYDFYQQLPKQLDQPVLDAKSLLFEGQQLSPFTFKHLLTETVDEKVYRRVERKDKFVKRVERILKEVAVDCALNKRINVFNNQLKKDVDYTRECDYMLCDYKCDGFGGRDPNDQPEINMDTYNLYFSEPQIMKIQRLIIHLFEINFVMRLDDIIYEITKDYDIEYTYIYEALDRIIGNPPNQKPLIIHDRFNRPGRLLFKHPYYIFHPDDILDLNAPLYYKTTPLTIKKRAINLNQLRGKTLTIRNIPSETPTRSAVNIEAILKEYASYLNNNHTDGKYEIHYHISRLQASDQALIYEASRIYPKYRALYDELNKYFKMTQKLYLFTSHAFTDIQYIGHHIDNIDRKYDDTKGKWIDVVGYDTQIESAKRHMDTYKTNYEDKRPILHEDILGFLEFDKIYKFKIIDYDNQQLKPTKKSVIETGNITWSKRTEKSGRLCSSYQLSNELIPMLNKLNININTKSLTKLDICKIIEIQLRKKDDTDTKRRWFLHMN